MLSETSSPYVNDATEPRESELPITGDTEVITFQEMTPAALEVLGELPDEFPAPQVSHIESIANSGLEAEILDCLRSGWSPSRISKYLFSTAKIVVSPAEIGGWLDDLPPEQVMPPSFLRRKLLMLDLQVDVTGEMARVIRLMEERLSGAMLAEELSHQPMTQIPRLADQYFDMLERYQKARQSLGELPATGAGEGGTVINNPQTVVVRSVRDIIQEAVRVTVEVDNRIGPAGPAGPAGPR